MKEDMDKLSMLWQQAKSKSSAAAMPDFATLMAQASARKKSAVVAHFGNAAILTLTVVVLVVYFYYLYNFQYLLSNIGIKLMIGGLVVRILLELYSVLRSRSINLTDTAAQSLENSVSFLAFRKRIHGPVTITIFVLYFIGFYMLTPEFSQYFSLAVMILLDAGALVVAAFLAFAIRKGIKKEVIDLEAIIALQKNLIQ